MKAIPDGEERIILATGRYIGEGFDDSRFDTLFFSNADFLAWNAPTICRAAAIACTKQKCRTRVRLVDTHVPMLMKMFQKRIKGYKAIGYGSKMFKMAYPEPEESPC